MTEKGESSALKVLTMAGAVAKVKRIKRWQTVRLWTLVNISISGIEEYYSDLSKKRRGSEV